MFSYSLYVACFLLESQANVYCTPMLYTRKGDDGTTKLFTSQTGERVSKSDPIFEALGTVDELNTIVGWCRAGCSTDWMIEDTPMRAIVLDVQHALFTIQAELAGAMMYIPHETIDEIEQLINTIEQQLPPIETFLIPGANELSARLDNARAVARRTERVLIAAHDGGVEIAEDTRVYLNRLSSLLYALVRFVNHKLDVDEQPPEYLM